MIAALRPCSRQSRKIDVGKGAVGPLIAWSDADFGRHLPGCLERGTGINLGAAIGDVAVDCPTDLNVERGQVRYLALVRHEAGGTADGPGIFLAPTRIAQRAIEARQAGRDVFGSCLYGRL